MTKKGHKNIEPLHYLILRTAIFLWPSKHIIPQMTRSSRRQKYQSTHQNDLLLGIPRTEVQGSPWPISLLETLTLTQILLQNPDFLVSTGHKEQRITMSLSQCRKIFGHNWSRSQCFQAQPNKSDWLCDEHPCIDRLASFTWESTRFSKFLSRQLELTSTLLTFLCTVFVSKEEGEASVVCSF